MSSPRINCVRLHWGSQSMTKTRFCISIAKNAAILPVRVVLPTPPLLLKNEIAFTFHSDRLPLHVSDNFVKLAMLMQSFSQHLFNTMPVVASSQGQDGTDAPVTTIDAFARPFAQVFWPYSSGVFLGAPGFSRLHRTPPKGYQLTPTCFRAGRVSGDTREVMT